MNTLIESGAIGITELQKAMTVPNPITASHYQQQHGLYSYSPQVSSVHAPDVTRGGTWWSGQMNMCSILSQSPLVCVFLLWPTPYRQLVTPHCQIKHHNSHFFSLPYCLMNQTGDKYTPQSCLNERIELAFILLIQPLLLHWLILVCQVDGGPCLVVQSGLTHSGLVRRPCDLRDHKYGHHHRSHSSSHMVSLRPVTWPHHPEPIDSLMEGA